MSNIHDEILNEMETEVEAGTRVTYSKRFKLEKKSSAVVRFLNVDQEAGVLTKEPTKAFFQRFGVYWAGKRPHYDRRTTGPRFGGDPDAPSAVHDVCEELSKHKRLRVREGADKLTPYSQYALYGLVLERDGKPVKGKDRWIPQRFELSKRHFETIKEFYVRYTKRNPLSILDLGRDGAEFLFKKDDFGKIDISLLEVVSVVPEEDLDRVFDKISANLVVERVTFPTPEEEQEHADKIRDEIMEERVPYAYSKKEDDGGRSARRHRGEDDDEDEESPRSRREDDRAPSRSSRAIDEDEDEAEPDLDDDEPAPRRSAARRQEDFDDEEPRRGARVVEAQPERESRPPIQPAARAAVPPPPARREAAPARREPSAPAPRSSSSDTIEDDPDVLPDETYDAAPAERSLPQPEVDELDEAPTPVNVKSAGVKDAPSAPGGLSKKLAENLGMAGNLHRRGNA